MPITLLNSQNNRRALSRGEGKSIGFADWGINGSALQVPIFIYIHGFKPVYMQDHGQLQYFRREVN
jgi:hypothetical protein